MPGALAKGGAQRTLPERGFASGPERAKIAVLISGSGTNMAALLYASRADDCPFEIVLVASNNPDAGGLRLRPDYWAERGGMDGFFMARLRLG